MKSKILLAIMLGGAFAAQAQGLQDGIEYYRADQPEEASIIINRVINDPSTDKATALFYLGQIALDNGDLAAAANNFEQGIAADKNNAYNYAGLGEVALHKGDKSKAESYFKQARGIDKKDATLVVEIARSYFDVDPVAYHKEIEKTIADARKIDRQEPAIFVLEADMLAKADNIGDAAGYYEMAMNNPKGVNHPEAFVKYARTYFPVNPRFAIKGLENYLSMQPNSALAQRELAEKYYENNQLTRAAEQYGKYIQNPNHFKKDEQRYVGLLYFGKKYGESNQLAEKILKEDPANFYMKRMRFLNFAALEDNEEALAAARQFFGSKGEFVPNDYTTYGEVLFATGQDSLAVAQYEKAVEIAPEKTSLLQDLSSAYTTAEMYDKAAEAQQKFIDKGDYSTNDLMVLARRYLNATANAEIGSESRAASAAKAVETINKVYELVPNNYQVRLTRARVLIAANDNEPNAEAAAFLEDILSELDSDPNNIKDRRNDYIMIFNQLGKYYLGVPDNEKAKQYYTRFLEIDPSNEALARFIETL